MCLFLENVKNMVTHDKGNTFKKIKKDLEDLGYILYYKVLNSSEYGNIPQNRERIYIIGFLEYEAEYEFPKKIDLCVKISDILEKDVNDSFYYDESSSIYDKLKDITKKKYNLSI